MGVERQTNIHTYIHTYIATHTHTFRKTISGNQARAHLTKYVGKRIKLNNIDIVRRENFGTK